MGLLCTGACAELMPHLLHEWEAGWVAYLGFPPDGLRLFWFTYCWGGGLRKKTHASPSERDQHSVAASGQTVLCNNHQGLGKWQQGRCKHWISALGHSGQGTKAGICWGFERSFWARFQLLLSPTHSWVPSWSPVRSRVLFRVTSFMPLLAPLAWQSAFPCSDNMEECVLNQACLDESIAWWAWQILFLR